MCEYPPRELKAEPVFDRLSGGFVTAAAAFMSFDGVSALTCEVGGEADRMTDLLSEPRAFQPLLRPPKKEEEKKTE